MAEVENEAIESLRALTGASAEACISALNEAEGEFETALELLRSTEAAGDESTAFERFERTSVDVDKLDEIVAELLMAGTRFEDADFNTSDWRILYKEEKRRWEWMCEGCHGKNEVPSEFRSPEAMRREFSSPEMRNIKCKQCEKEVPLKAVLMMRVWGFLRPEAVRDEVTRMQIGRLDQWRLFRGRPEASDVHQGMIGNCWFLAAVAVVAERRPELLTRLFWNSEISEVGLYAVKLFVNGEWRWILVDDLLPVNAIGNLAHSSSLRFQLWLPLLEKAAAKVAGSYEALHGGSFGEAFALLTGQPTEDIMLDDRNFSEPSDQELLWSRLVSWDAAGYLLGACCVATKELSVTQLNDLGLQAPHGYTIIKTVEYEGERLIHLRNPIGERSVRVWQGSWGFASMSAQAKRDLKVVNVNGDFLVHPKADFFVTFAEFVKYFTVLEVCRSDDWPGVSHSAWLRQDADFTGFRVRWFPSAKPTTSALTTPCDISMYQEVSKFRQISANLDLGFAFISEAPVATPDGEVLCTEVHRRGEASAETHLQSETSYMVVPLSFSETRENRRVALTLHVPDEAAVVISSFRLTRAELTQGIFAYLKKHGKFSPTSVPGLSVLTGLVPGVGCVFAAENAGIFPITVAIDALDSQGVEASRGTLMTEDTLKEGHKAAPPPSILIPALEKLRKKM